jgi:DNA-binding transcriptional ArsR family regulator
MQATLSKAELFALLSDSNRRTVLESLARTEESVSVESLVADILDRRPTETDVSVHELRMAVYNVHVPVLIQTGLVEYDPISDVVSGDPRRMGSLHEMMVAAERVVTPEAA